MGKIQIDGSSHISRICLCCAGLTELRNIRTKAWSLGVNRKCDLLGMGWVEKERRGMRRFLGLVEEVWHHFPPLC